MQARLIFALHHLDREVLSYSGVPKEHPFVKESPELFWYAVRVTYSRELALKEYLDGECIENFIPMHYEYIVKNERRVRKLVPAVHNLVFTVRAVNVSIVSKTRWA